VRASVGAEFPVSVKLNSADFQRGGFAFEDSLQVAKWLEQAGLDLIEISGGTYEQPKLLGIEGLEPPEAQRNVAASTIAREAYFVDFAKAMKAAVSTPLMVTGGLRTRVRPWLKHWSLAPPTSLASAARSASRPMVQTRFWAALLNWRARKTNWRCCLRG
jgi:hypothetical protein